MANTELEGLSVSSLAQTLSKKWAEGQMTDEELISAYREKSLSRSYRR